MPSAPRAPRRQPNVLARATTLAGTALLAAALLVGAGAAPVTGWNQGAAEATLWQLLNGARANNGLNVLIQHGTLLSIARWRSQDMVQRSYFSHTILGTSYQVYHWYDLNGVAYSLGGENIAWNNGYSDADSPIAAHNGFMASQGHRDNILRPGFTHGAVGAYGADNVSFLGSVRSPRVYTELFLTSPGGGGGGGGGGGRRRWWRWRRRRWRWRRLLHARTPSSPSASGRPGPGQARLGPAHERDRPPGPRHGSGSAQPRVGGCRHTRRPLRAHDHGQPSGRQRPTRRSRRVRNAARLPDRVPVRLIPASGNRPRPYPVAR